MKMSIKKYLFFTFLLSHGCWWSIIIANQFGYLKYGTPISMLLYLLGAWSPSIFGIRYKMSNSNLTIKMIVKDILHFRQPPIFYIMLLVSCLSFYITPLLLNEITLGLPVYITILAIPVMMFGGGLEELGWRNLQLQLEKRLSFFLASFITGCIWISWHLPLFLINGSEQSKMNPISYIIYMFGFAFLLGAISRITKSVWLCALFHCLMNVGHGSFIVNETIMINTISTVIMMTLALVLITVFKNNGYQSNVRNTYLVD
ncbi:MAG: CPBP family intramembrane glutamic endopeptidase [Coprobacillaceae bacterium]